MFKKVASLGWVMLFLVSIVMPTLQVSAITPTGSLVIYQLQTGGGATTGSATQEFISLYNNSSAEIDVTGWCITKSASADGAQVELGCLKPDQTNVKLVIPAAGTITAATNDFVLAHPTFKPDLVFTNGSLATNGGHIRIIDSLGQEIDKLGWGAATSPEPKSPAAIVVPKGNILQRKTLIAPQLQDTDNNSADFVQDALTILPASSLYEQEVLVDVCANISGLQTALPAGYLFDAANNCQKDACSNRDGLQIDVPDGYIAADTICTIIPPENATLILTELLPNASSYDTGKEFIELYNPNKRAVNLLGYILQLGPKFDKNYPLPDQIILPGAYLAFNDTQTNIVLPNTSASLRLIAPSGDVVSLTNPYIGPAENYAWALIGTVWQYTNQATPAAANLADLDPPVVAEDVEVVTLAPCPTGQYRNQQTNRCRLIEVITASLTPCGVGQERNPETNRCRLVVLAASTLVPCSANQERNPATNRCRSIDDGDQLTECATGQERNPKTNRCRKVASAVNGASTTKIQDVATGGGKNNTQWWLAAAAIFAALGYAAYEWRRDISNIFLKHRLKKQP